MTWFRGRILCLLGAAFVLGVLAPVAAADQPTRTEIPPTDPFVIGAQFCGFSVVMDNFAEREKILDFGDHAIITGALKWRLTNLTNSRTVELNISGPIHAELTPDGMGAVIRHEGRTLFSIGPRVAERVGIEKGLYLSTGLVVVEVDFAIGVTRITQVGGTWTDVCDLLA
jgi:hypothetical protein